MQIIYWAFSVILGLTANHPSYDGFDFEKAWKKVEEYRAQGLPKSALAEVEIIFTMAKKENNPVQLAKAIKVKSELTIETDENGVKNTADWLESERQTLPEPVRQIAASYLAEMYRQYYENNRYQISQRSVTAMTDSTDFFTWNSTDFQNRILSLYLFSLEGKGLDNHVDAYKTLLSNPETCDAFIRPTLYTLLWDRLYQYLTSVQGQVNLSLESEYVMTDPRLLGNRQDFLSMSFDDATKEDPVYQILKAYRTVITHCLQENMRSLADYDLSRLSFVYQHGVIPHKDSLYERTLQSMSDVYRQNEYVTQVYSKLAAFHQSKNEFEKALARCNEAVKMYPSSSGAVACRYISDQITKKEVSLTTEEVFSTAENPRFALDYRNLENVRINVFRLTPGEQNTNLDEPGARYEALRKNAITVYDKKWSLPVKNPYHMHFLEGSLPKFGFGRYLVEITTNTENENPALLNYAIFHVSDLAASTVRDADKITYRVAHRMSGKPVKGADITLYQVDYRTRENIYRRTKEKSIKTDKNGFATFDVLENKRVEVVIQQGKDKLDLGHENYHYKYNDRVQEFRFAEIFTDRAIYRPGQTMYFKAIALVSGGNNKHEVIADVPLEVNLLDANYQVVSSQKLRTNSFGSVAGSFAIPTGLLTGSFQISIQSKKGVSGQKFIRVEEYKRPSFEVLIDTFTKMYALNENADVTGSVKNYAGNAVDGAEVRYKVVRGTRFIDWGWWWRPAPVYGGTERVITSGKVKTDKDGKYSFTFKALPDETVPVADNPIFDYRVEVVVTDKTGESQRMENRISVGYTALQLVHGLAENADVSKLQPFFVRLENLQEITQTGQVNLQIEKLKEPKKVPLSSYWNQENRVLYIQDAKDKIMQVPKPLTNRFDEWPVEKLVWQSSFASSDPVYPGMIKEAGVYKLTSSATDIFGKKVQRVTYHVITNREKKAFPKSDILFISTERDIVEPGQDLVVHFGAAEKPVFAWVLVEKNGKVVYDQSFKIAQAFQFSFPVREEYRGGLHVHVNYVYDNRHYVQTIFADVPFSNKELDIRLETFREKIYPGSKETYTFKVSGKNKDAVAAEILTTMYDASLETFAVNTWRKSYYDRDYSRLFRDKIGFQAIYNYELHPDWNRIPEPGTTTYQYPLLDGFSVYGMGWPNAAMYDEVVLESRAGGRQKSMPDAVPAPMAKQVGDIAKEEVQPEPEAEKPQAPAVRKNLSELVFFYPQLTTDSAGNAGFTFTMNEALTRWKMMTFAHTPDMKVGYDERYVQTYKKVMVFPNTPRFVRGGDQLVFTAKIVNTETKSLPVTVSMKLLDIVTGQDVTSAFCQANIKQNVEIDAATSGVVSWQVDVPSYFTGTLAWTVIAEAEGHSDGEENILPVLTNKVLVTETFPIYAHGKQKRTWVFGDFVKNLSETKKDNRFTIEYTSHPVWYVIQALPYLKEQEYENTVHLINRYFGNSVSAAISKSNPRINAVFERWRGQEPGAMVSKIFSNPELKSALAQETPWILEGLEEEEQKRNIALLFDANQMKNEMATVFAKLKERQMPQGAFPWFVNGRPDLYITQYIVETLGQMKQIGLWSSKDREISEMAEKAISFADTEMLYWYKKNKDPKTGMQIVPVHELGFQYLYMRSFFPDITLPAENQEMYNYYFKKASDEWLKQNLYTQAMIGIVMRRAEDKTADKIYKSLEERAFTNEETGKYWNAGNGYRWDELPVERHSLLISFYNEMKVPSKTLDAMKLWLLKNKQTRHWRTTKSTVTAMYALLIEGEQSGSISWLEEKQPVAITMGGQAVDFGKAESGTGYVKKQWADQTFPKSWGTITVHNPNESTSWGAAYYQYFEDMDNVKAASDTPLKVDKKIYLVRESNKGEVLDEITEKTALKPGDRIKVRLRLISDRSINYVHLKDARPSGFEPVSALSGHAYQGGLSYYENIKDLATHFYFDVLPKGDFTLEYTLKIVHKGRYSAGFATLQSMYAPEFSSHSAGKTIVVE